MALSNEYIGRSHHLSLPDTNEIITLCREKGLRCSGFTYPPNGSPIAFIKYGYTLIMGEMRTQRYVYDAFKQMMNASGSGVMAQEIYCAFECEGQTYIVMDYIDGEIVSARLRSSSAETKNWIFDQVAKAISQIIRVPVPNGSRPGPVAGGCIPHYFFRYDLAPKEYDSVDEMQRHIIKVLKLGGSKDEVDFSNEEMCLCY